MTDLPGRGFRRLYSAAVVCLHTYRRGADEKGGQWWSANLRHVDIPNTVVSIGKEAFMDCDSLRKITIPEGVEEIGESAFQGCSKLEKVIMAVPIIHPIEIYLSLKQYTIGRN